MDQDNDREPCENFTPHPIRKHCINCRKNFEDHPLTEDDVDKIKTHVTERMWLQEQLTPQQHTEYAWIPLTCPENRIDEYFKKFPDDKIPRHKSEGQKYRLRQLAHQVPLSDISQECRFLDSKYREEFEEYAQKVKSTILRAGNVRESTPGMPIQCRQCLFLINEDELVVRISENKGVVFHPTCFKCLECGELLADLIHCLDEEGKVHCLRHYSERVKKRCHACDELIFNRALAQAGNQFYHKEHLLCVTCNVLMESKDGCMKNGEIYCSPCFEELFSDDWNECQKIIIVDYKQVSFQVCEICDNVRKYQEYRTLECGHAFHTKCLVTELFKKRKRCPTCFGYINLRLLRRRSDRKSIMNVWREQH